MYDGFVAVLDATGSVLEASTYLGGSGHDAAATWAPGFELLLANDVALDHAGNPVVAGITASLNFPTTPGAFQPTYRGGLYDGVVVRMDLGLSRLTYSTYLGGNGLEWVGGLAITAQDRIAVSGMTGSPNFPTTPGPFDRTYDPVTSCQIYAEAFVRNQKRTLGERAKQVT